MMLLCPNCGTKNRVERHFISKQAFCGRCHALLPESGLIRILRLGNRHIYWIILIMISGGALIFDQLKTIENDSSFSSRSSPPRESYTVEVNPDYVQIPISQGIQTVATHEELIAPLSIRTPSGDESYFVKILDLVTGKTIMTLFINAGQILDVNAPLGTYRIRYASGKTWYGEQHLFGPSTRFNEVEKTFTFTQIGEKVNGFSIE